MVEMPKSLGSQSGLVFVTDKSTVTRNLNRSGQETLEVEMFLKSAFSRAVNSLLFILQGRGGLVVWIIFPELREFFNYTIGKVNE
jgi:hypothetical protein